MPKSTAARKGSSEVKTRKTVYPKPGHEFCIGRKAITVKQAKKLLGWQREHPEEKWGNDHITELATLLGYKVRCHNNVSNRPVYRAILLTLCQEHLRRRWQWNGEPIIIGKTGLILNGQHSLLSLILAGHELTQEPDRWSEYWTDNRITMEKSIAYGVEETDDVINTMDTCKPRSLADVIFRSQFFSKIRTKDRKRVARMADYAVRLLWHRTGVGSAYALRRTHAESLAFIESHPKIVECVSKVFKLNKAKGVSKFISPGTAAGLLYLMGSCSTDGESYHTPAEPNEDTLDWDQWDQACKFWEDLATGKLRPVQIALGQLLEDSKGSATERCAVLSKAWVRYQAGGKMTPKQLSLKYHTNDDGIRSLVERPTVGGIDSGGPSDADVVQAEKTPRGEPSPKQILNRAARERARRSEGVQARRRAKNWGKGDRAWVTDPDGDHWLGKIVDIYDTDLVTGDTNRMCLLRVVAGFAGADNEYEQAISDLGLEQPVG